MSLRQRVIAAYRSLHRARQQVFKNDAVALEAGKYKIREEFRKNAKEINPEIIQKHAKTAEETADLLKKTIVQAALTDKGTYKLSLTGDSHLQNNVQILKRNMSDRKKLEKG